MLNFTIRVSLGAVGSVLLGLAASVPLAHAFTPQEQEYIDRVHAAGVVGDPAKIAETARAVCRHTAEGVSVDEMANTLAQGSMNVNGAEAITIDQAYGMVTTAQSTVCPSPSKVGEPDCVGIAAAMENIPPGTTDVLAALRVMPGLNYVDSGVMFTCGLAAAMNDPGSIGNNQQVFTGVCRGIEGLAPFGTAHNFVCGTPAG